MALEGSIDGLMTRTAAESSHAGRVLRQTENTEVRLLNVGTQKLPRPVHQLIVSLVADVGTAR